MSTLAITPKQLAAVYRVRADAIYYDAHDNTPGPASPEQITHGIIYQEYLAMAALLESFADNPGPIMSKAGEIKLGKGNPRW